MTNESVNFYCKQCEYNLRGLDSDRCPECGCGFDRDDATTYLEQLPNWWGRIPLGVRKFAGDMIIGYAVGTAFASLAALLMAFDFEVLAVGPLIGLYGLIPIGLWSIIVRRFGRRRLAECVYWIIAGPWLVFYLGIVLTGVEMWQLAMLVFVVSAAFCVSCFGVLMYRR